jgi:hypothetical protein
MKLFLVECRAYMDEDEDQERDFGRLIWAPNAHFAKIAWVADVEAEVNEFYHERYEPLIDPADPFQTGNGHPKPDPDITKQAHDHFRDVVDQHVQIFELPAEPPAHDGATVVVPWGTVRSHEL